MAANNRVAVDMDDVLAESTANLYMWHNTVYNTDLVVEKDAKHLAHWLNRGFGDYHTFQDKFDRWCASTEFTRISAVKDARDALQNIKDMGYRLSVVTARRPELAELSREFIERHYDGLFDDIYLCAPFRDEASRQGMNKDTLDELLDPVTRTTGGVGIHWVAAPKSVVCTKIGASFLIDDSIQNAVEVKKNGPKGIRIALYEYGMSYQERMARGYKDKLSLTKLPTDVVRCATWSDVVCTFEKFQH